MTLFAPVCPKQTFWFGTEQGKAAFPKEKAAFLFYKT
jgi:hypothetical protein